MALATAMAALLPQSPATRSWDSRVDDVRAVTGEVRRLKQAGDAVLFVPVARRDSALVCPDDFAGLRDIAPARGPVASGTLSGEEAAPGRIRSAMPAQRRILLVTDAAPTDRPTGRDRTKSAVLGRYFTVVADRRARGRRVTVYERNRQGPPARHAPAGRA
ncbi:hypothetical protein HZZ00_03460 [Streptomyces sp. NEAU-sy36]|uniref:hypothetical protein n=1 Tax=unclassified Streptomyces TaxID=2593676 RepID=UPI0015D5C385|nr:MULTISPECIES: hypothetical protein [unclassified Streptomyces]QLJ00124.1 hypothetical protein HZZ00_03460 [Streptomyces sp. NEAU-sy36]